MKRSPRPEAIRHLVEIGLRASENEGLVVRGLVLEIGSRNLKNAIRTGCNPQAHGKTAMSQVETMSERGRKWPRSLGQRIDRASQRARRDCRQSVASVQGL